MTDQRAITALQPFLALAKSATGRAAADLVVQATQSRDCFVFAELLDCPNIQALSDATDGSKYLELLKVFAYGNYGDYKARADTLPPLNDKQLEKLKQLSLITMASRGNQFLTYDSLLTSLDIPSVRLLEDLVISAIYADLLAAKLDTKSQFVEVFSTAGRDVARDDIPSMIESLTVWCKRCEDVLAEIDEQMKTVHREAAAKKKTSEEYEAEVTKKKEALSKDLGAGKGKRVASSEGDEGVRGEDDDVYMEDAGAEKEANSSRRRAKHSRFGNLMGGTGGPHKRR